MKMLTGLMMAGLAPYERSAVRASRQTLEASLSSPALSAREKASKLLTKVNIKKEIEKRIDAILEDKKELSVKWIREVKKLAFSDLRDVVEWGGQGSLTAKCPGCGKYDNAIILKDSKQLDNNIASAITEVSNTASGIKVKLASKEKALDLLGKYLSLFTENINLTHSIKKEDLEDMFKVWNTGKK